MKFPWQDMPVNATLAVMENWEAFARFMNSVQTARIGLDLRPHQDPFYRGHPDSSFTLLPSLFRQAYENAEDYWRVERRTFFQFRALARDLYQDQQRDWDILFAMQHHGVPTRLLDWTSVFGVALYFSLLRAKGEKETTPCIWLLSPNALNNATWKNHNLYHPKYLARDHQTGRSYDFGELLMRDHPDGWGRLPWPNALAIYDSQRNVRMFAQSGWFTIHGTNIEPLETTFKNRPDILTKVDLPDDAIPAAKEFLLLAGIGHRQLFPGLDGLAKSVRERFELPNL